MDCSDTLRVKINCQETSDLGGQAYGPFVFSFLFLFLFRPRPNLTFAIAKSRFSGNSGKRLLGFLKDLSRPDRLLLVLEYALLVPQQPFFAPQSARVAGQLAI